MRINDLVKKLLYVFWMLMLSFSATTQTQAQSTPGLGQHIGVMKVLYPGLKIIGVMGRDITEKMMQDLTRAGLGQGIQITIGRPKDAQEISAIYKKMVNEKGVQMLWIPESRDDLMMGVGFEYLRSTALLDKVGLCVPNQSLLASGALCSVQLEAGKVVTYVNQKIAGVLGINVPNDQESKITFVSR
jgi:ABC-type uncharacterized transport system substrate-binding protein